VREGEEGGEGSKDSSVTPIPNQDGSFRKDQRMKADLSLSLAEVTAQESYKREKPNYVFISAPAGIL